MGEISLGKDEFLYEVAKDIVIDAQECSVKFIQKRLEVGYDRATLIMKALEERGVVSSLDGRKIRKVLIKK
jgi:S-DNA-T family DNA segregation ATPase FtsK/SpoIIIE